MSGSPGSTTSATTIPPWLDSAGQYMASQGANLQGGAQYNPMQQGAALTANQYGQMAPGALGQAYNTYSSGANYGANQSGYGPLMAMLSGAGGGGGGGGGNFNSRGGGGNQAPVNAAQAAISTIDPSRLSQYQSGQLGSTDLTPYLNPYTQDVTNTTLAGMNQNLAQQQAQNSAGAASAGAFGGTRQAVQAALTNQAAQQTAASTLANLNQANFSQAQQGAQYDISGRNQASQYNAGVQNAALMANAGYQNAGSQFNAGQSNQLTQAQMMANAQMAAAQSSASGQVGAASANANASMYDARLQAALGLGNNIQQGGYEAALLRQGAGTSLQNFGQTGMGAQGQWGNQMYQQPMQNLGWYGNLLHGTATNTGTNSTTQSASNPWASAAGYGLTAAQLYGMYGGGGG